MNIKKLLEELYSNQSLITSEQTLENAKKELIAASVAHDVAKATYKKCEENYLEVQQEIIRNNLEEICDSLKETFVGKFYAIKTQDNLGLKLRYINDIYNHRDAIIISYHALFFEYESFHVNKNNKNACTSLTLMELFFDSMEEVDALPEKYSTLITVLLATDFS